MLTIAALSAASLPRVVLAVAGVAALAWLAGTAATRLAQPRVIGELVAVMSLGPSALGAVAPGVPAFLFPPAIHGVLVTIGQAGVVLFMFFVGVEFEGGLLKARPRVGVAVASVSVALPLLLGVAVALPFAGYIAAPPARPWLCALFVGVALSVTAFPILAAIVEETPLTTPSLGQLALGCAAGTDVVAWLMLAVLSAQVHASAEARVAERLLAVAALAIVVLVPLRRALRRGLRSLPERAQAVAVPAAGLALAASLASATDHLGVTVIFGAFLAGLALNGEPRALQGLLARVRRVNRFALLPVFFVLVGLAANLHAAAGSLPLAGIGVLLLVAAVVGKVGGVSVAARCSGLGWRDAFGLGALLNTKGLTEIVVLGVGYHLGLISAAVLGMLVAVALVTTASTVPLLLLLELAHGTRESAIRYEIPATGELGP